MLAVAGSDSSGGAGLQGDVKTLFALGVHAMTVVTAVTAQDSRGVRTWWPVPADAVRAQLRAVLGDIGTDAVKVGMLGAPETAAAVAAELAGAGVPVVLDPVLASTRGDPLADADDARLVARVATVVTPNLAEVAALAGVRVGSAGDLAEAAEAVLALGPRWALVKGGHLPSGDAVDLLAGAAGERLELRAARVANRHTHGTGCALASALAAYLARGHDVPDAARRAKDYVTEAIRRGFPLGSGTGPIDHGLTWRP